MAQAMVVWLLLWLPARAELLGQTTIYTESFSNWSGIAPANWSLSGGLPGWAPADSLPPGTRPSIAGCDFGGAYARFPASASNGSSSALISPSLNLSGFGPANLELLICVINPGAQENDGIEIQLSGDNGASWTSLGVDSSTYNSWTTLTVPIPPTFNTNQFRFQILGFGQGAALDLGVDRIRIFNPAPPCPAQASQITANLPNYICIDASADVIQLQKSGANNAFYSYVLCDAFDRVLEILPADTVDLNQYEADEYHIYGASYWGTLIPVVNQPVQSLSATGCIVLSTNYLSAQLVELTGTTTVLSDFLGFDVSASDAQNGVVKAEVTGGSGAYHYSWSGNTGISSPVAVGLPAGPQLVQVVDSITGCSWTDSLNLLAPAPLELRLRSNPQYQGASISCTGASDGSLQADITGGIPPYQIRWSHDSTLSTLSANGLKAGTYTLTVTDANGAAETGTYLLLEPNPVQINEARVKALCPGQSGGRIAITATGGTGDIAYRWDHGPSQPVIENLDPGTYALRIEDANGCQFRDTFAIQTTSLPRLLLIGQDPSCYGGADGEIEVYVQGGTAPFQHAWQHGATGDSLFQLRAGTYEVQTTDANGCQATEQVALTHPQLLQIRLRPRPDGGSGSGRIEAEVSGGTPPYQYHWSNGSDSAIASNLTRGDYTLTVTDGRGCESEASAEVLLSDLPDCLHLNMGFSPNGDGMNDRWVLPCLAQYQAYEVQVFNRWGQRLYFSLQYDLPWDGISQGQPLPDGTYYYLIRIRQDERWTDFTGTLSIVR